MSEKKWELFVELLSEVANESEGTWQERKQQTIREFKKRSEDNSLEEFLGWFDGTVE